MKDVGEKRTSVVIKPRPPLPRNWRWFTGIHDRTWHRVQQKQDDKDRQGQSRAGTLRLNCMMQTRTRNKIQPLVASDCTSGLGSGELILKILQVILISSENHFSKWPMFKKNKKESYTIWNSIKGSGKKYIYIHGSKIIQKLSRLPNTWIILCFTYYVWDIMSWR